MVCTVACDERAEVLGTAATDADEGTHSNLCGAAANCDQSDTGWNLRLRIELPSAAGSSASMLHASTRRIVQPLIGAQNHIPAAYCLCPSFLSLAEMASLSAWFTDRTASPLAATTFDGEPLSEDRLSQVNDGPVVYQLYGRPEHFEHRFPLICERLLRLKDAVGSALGLSAEELEQVTFPQDIRYIQYTREQSCPWHCDDPVSHFNIVMMLSRPQSDFEGGVFSVHPGPCAHGDDGRSVPLKLGDAVIYTAAKVDHAVSTVSAGARQICLMELRKRSLARLVETPCLPPPGASDDRPATVEAPIAATRLARALF